MDAFWVYVFFEMCIFIGAIIVDMRYPSDGAIDAYYRLKNENPEAAREFLARIMPKNESGNG